MDDISILLYLIIRSIFDKLDFRITYIEEIEKRIEYIDSKDFYILANSVFFKFTNKMIELVKKREYKNILKEYLSYKNYWGEWKNESKWKMENIKSFNYK